MSSLTKSEFIGNSRVGSLLNKCHEVQAHITSVQEEDGNFSQISASVISSPLISA